MTQTAVNNARDFAAVLAAAARQLVSVDHRRDGAFVTLPMLYPSGASVLVRVEPSGDGEFFVSDYGLGFTECDMLGATHIYKTQAARVAENAGVKFDTNAFFVIKIGHGQLAGAVAAIGNCSLEAVTVTAMRHAERRSRDGAVLLHQRLISIFTEKYVAKDVRVTGESQTVWEVANVVKSRSDPDHITIFEPVVFHASSIAAVAMKFNDIARLERPPVRVAVVRQKAEFGTYLGVLSQAGNVVSQDVSTRVIEKLAAAKRVV